MKLRDGVFVSYAHADSRWLEPLQRVFAKLPESLRVVAWDDTRIAAGARWRVEIQEALETAAAAVLLLSPSFFRSEFIATQELPEVLAAAGRGELTVLPMVVACCDHAALTNTYQAVHDPASPLESLDEAGLDAAWQRLQRALEAVAATVDDEARIGAESVRLAHDVEASAAVAHVLDKIARAQVDPAFEGNEWFRQNTLVLLEKQRCEATATWLMEEIKRPDLAPVRSKAVVRMLEKVSLENEAALQRATELTQQFATETLKTLQSAKGTPPAGN